MSDYISREAFVEQKRKQYCEDCTRRKGFKRGQYKTLYEIGEAPCRACEIDDVLNDVEDFPAADVRPVVRGKWIMNDECRTVCSLCGNVVAFVSHPDRRWDFGNYCPNCGADMKQEADDDEP